MSVNCAQKSSRNAERRLQDHGKRAALHLPQRATLPQILLQLSRAARRLSARLRLGWRERRPGASICAAIVRYAAIQVYTVALGGLTIRQNFTTSGSGSTWLMTYLDMNWRPNMPLEEVQNVRFIFRAARRARRSFQLVRTGVNLAIHRDGSSGGVIRMAIIDKNGTRREHFRADKGELLNFPAPTVYPTYPPHIVQHPTQ